MSPTKTAIRRRAAALAGAQRAMPFVDVHILMPPELRNRLELVRRVDGRPLSEWIRATLAIEADRVLTSRLGLLWARPDAPIYRPPGFDRRLGNPVAATCGGERVLVLARLEGLGPFSGDEGPEHVLSGVGYVCDLWPLDSEGVSMRRVFLRAVDAVPLPPPADRQSGPSSLPRS